MARIIATIDYDPQLDLAGAYPDHVKTKADAMRFDVQLLMDGLISDNELVAFADDIIWEVVE